MTDLEYCPKCQVGHLKPTGQPSTSGSMRIFVCDNDDCGTKIMKTDKES